MTEAGGAQEPLWPGAAPVWVGGKLAAPEEAVVSALDHGFVVGDGVFEVLMARPGGVFALEGHLARLQRSADALGLPLPEPKRVEAAISAVVAQVAEESILRVTWTGGIGPLSSARSLAEPTLVVAAQPLPQRPGPASVVIAPWTRNPSGPLAGVKSTSYAGNVRALAYAKEHHCDEALFLNTHGRVCEGTGSNVFAVVGGELVTPPLAEGCLAGITRAAVLALTGATERPLGLAEFRSAEEAFLTSTTRGVQAIASLDGVALGRPGPATLAAGEAFGRLYADPGQWAGG